jgi:hypothetical protein
LLSGGKIIDKRPRLNYPLGNFMITYIYHRPSIKDDIAATLESEVLSTSSGRAVLTFDYGVEPKSELRVFIRAAGDPKPIKVWSSGKEPTLLRTQSIPLSVPTKVFQVIFAAKVSPVYPYGPRTYLSQVLVSNPVLSFI